MLSRSAERLYWFARYIERAENTARLMLVHHHLILDLPKHVRPSWGLLIDVLGANEEFEKTGKKISEKNANEFVFGSRENFGSIISSLKAARENIRTTREVMPSDAWERVNSLYLSVARRGKQGLPRSTRHKVLNDIILRCQQITGMLSGTMNEDEAYQFIRIGRNLERADMTTRIIDVGSAQLLENDDNHEEGNTYRAALWVSVLKSLSAHQMYNQHVSNRINASDVLAFLLQSKLFPRSDIHALQEIKSSISSLPRAEEPVKIIDEVQQELSDAKIPSLRGKELHAFIDELQLHLEQIHEIIFKTWFDPDLISLK